jgi:hypothetical protein
MRNKILHARIKNGLIRRLNQFNLFLKVRQIQEFGTDGKQVLIIASGSMKIPNSGWGAVEKIISETIQFYVMAGFRVTLLNSKHYRDWKKLSDKEFEVILCHDDSLITKAKKYFPQQPLVAVTHYGSLINREQWDRSFQNTFKDFKYADFLVALSPACREVLHQSFPQKNIHLCPNGIIPQVYVEHPERSRAIYLGKIEDRKKQAVIAESYSGLPIDFVGPGQLKNITSAPSTQGVRFLGEKNREWLRENLASYKLGILLSDSEADALVLYEYQNAGLQVIASSSAVGSQDPNLPWIHVSNLKKFKSTFEKSINTKIDPLEITNYSKEFYSWEKRIIPYIELLKEASL